MSVIDFPTAPDVNDEYAFGDRTWRWNGSAWESVSIPYVGYRYAETVYFTSSGTFSKATYPWLRAIRVRAVGGGGGGGGAGTTTAGQVAPGGGGVGAAYAERFITDIAGLASSVTVTVAAAGTGGAAGANAGTNGGTSAFGSLVSASGGSAGGAGVATGNTNVFGTSNVEGTGTGDIVIASTPTQRVAQAMGGDFQEFRSHSGGGGGSVLGQGGPGRTNNGNGTNASSLGKGGGGGGGFNAESQATARSGGNGTAGIVILELFA